MANAVLLTTAHETENGLEIDAYWPRSFSNPESLYTFYLGPNPPKKTRVLQLDACARGGDRFDIVGSGERVSAMIVDIEPKPGGIDHGKPLYLPVHGICLQLAECFIDSMKRTSHTPSDDRITSIKKLWEVLYRRLNGTHTSFPPRMGALPEPHDYFGGRLCRNVEWEPGDDIQHAKVRILILVYLDSCSNNANAEPAA